MNLIRRKFYVMDMPLYIAIPYDMWRSVNSSIELFVKCKWATRNQQLWSPAKRINKLGIHRCSVCQGVSNRLVIKMKAQSYKESLFGSNVFVYMLCTFLWFFVPFYRSLPLRIGVIANLYDFRFVGNECWGVIKFNDLLPIDPPIMLLLI